MDPLEVITSSAVALLVLKEATTLVKTVLDRNKETSSKDAPQSFRCGLEHGVLKEVVERSFDGMEKIMAEQTEILKGLSDISKEQIVISRRAVAFAEGAAKHAEENNRMLMKRKG